jgi:hypothetical protein
MARKPKDRQRGAAFGGQQLALPVAAHLAGTQLLPDPMKLHDGQHRSDLLDGVAQALARTATLYYSDPQSGEPRELTPAELEGALARGGAAELVLKDGRTLAGVTLRRADLQQAIAVLKPADAGATPPAAGNTRAAADALIERVQLIEALVHPPLEPAQLERAKSAAVFIARHAPHGRVANLAMQLMSTLHEPRAAEDEAPGGFRMALARLRAALEQQNV